MRNIKCLGQVDNVLWRGSGLAIEDGCRGYLVAPDLLGDVLEAEFLLRLGGEEGLRRGR
jgi:hypothetical protein